MGVPFSQIVRVASYVISQKLRGRKRYPLVLMIEPLLRCNLSCAGCGKIQHPPDVLRRQLTPEQCFSAADECPTPIVSLAGGEPLLHPQIDTIVSGLLSRKRFVYLCTNALTLQKSLGKFSPSKYLSFSVHIDGLATDHDRAVCRSGVFDTAIEGIRQALATGFRVTTNTTLFDDAAPPRIRKLFDQLMSLGVEGLMVSPGYRYAKAPDQDHFLARQRTIDLFRKLLEKPNRRWKFNHSPLFLQFLQGRWELQCTPWGNPTYNIFGWQRPCYLLDEQYVPNFDQLLYQTNWDNYGHNSGNPKCEDCMVHCGHEASAVTETFGSLKGLLAATQWVVFGPPRPATNLSLTQPEPNEGSQPDTSSRALELPVLNRHGS